MVRFKNLGLFIFALLIRYIVIYRKKIIYNGEDIVNVLKEISFILCSLPDIGSCYSDCMDDLEIAGLER